MKEELEVMRYNVTPAQFAAYVRSMIRKHKFTAICAEDIRLDYWAAGNDLEFDTCNKEHMQEFGYIERSISKPYEMQTYIQRNNGEVFNQIMEFNFDTEKIGSGYFYYVNVSID